MLVLKLGIAKGITVEVTIKHSNPRREAFTHKMPTTRLTKPANDSDGFAMTIRFSNAPGSSSCELLEAYPSDRAKSCEQGKKTAADLYGHVCIIATRLVRAFRLRIYFRASGY